MKIMEFMLDAMLGVAVIAAVWLFVIVLFSLL
jgi:hypothetical protein